MAGLWISSKNYAFDRGMPAVGAIAQFFQAATFTPMTVYYDYGLTISAGSSVIANSNGQWPVVYLDEGQGFYRYQTLKPDGAILDDLTTLPIIGPGAGSGGGGGTPVDTTQLLTTGDFIWRPVLGQIAGRVRANALTIGPAGSGATERANADCQNLFTYLWGALPNTVCPVSGGRGATAIADWNNNKMLGLPDLRGRAAFGLDTMGNVAAGRISGAIYNPGGSSPGSSGGVESIQITVGHLPAHTHPLGTATVQSGGGATVAQPVGGSATGSTGGNAKLPILPPGMTGTWFIKL